MDKKLRHCLGMSFIPFQIALILMMHGCAFQEFRGNPDEQVIYNRIQELKQSERYILASEYAKKFKEHFPKSDKLEELDLLVADQEFENKHWEFAEDRYKKFITEFPKSKKNEYANNQLQKIVKEESRFHKHFDYNIFVGPQLLSTGDLSNSTESPHNMNHLSVSYYFKPKHGVFFGGQSHYFKADDDDISEAVGRSNKGVMVSIVNLGYLHRWKLTRKFNLVYGIGAGREFLRFSDGKSPYNGGVLGFNEFLTLDYCAFANKRSPCWNGIFPSFGLFHLYSPNGSLGGSSMKGHLLGLGIGLKI